MNHILQSNGTHPWVARIAQHTQINFPGGSDSKASVYNVRDLGSIPGLGRFPGEGNGNPLQYTCALKIPWMEELGAGYYPWGHKESARLSDFTFTFTLTK